GGCAFVGVHALHADRPLEARPAHVPAHAVGHCARHRSAASLNRTRRFVKSVPIADAAMLDAEAEGLRALAACGAIVVPEVIEQGMRGDEAFLATSWLDFGDAPRGEAMGRAVARLHRIAPGKRYGWARDNFIGRTPQVNGW